MCLHLMCVHRGYRTEEVTEPALQVSCRVSILPIVLSCNTMLEIIQILDVQEALGGALG